MLLLWAILFIVVAIGLGVIAFSGVAIAMSFMTKIFFMVSFLCFLIALILIIIEKIKVREHQKQ